MANSQNFTAKNGNQYKLTLLNATDPDFERLRVQATELPTVKEPLWPGQAWEIQEDIGSAKKLNSHESFISVLTDAKNTVVGMVLQTYDKDFGVVNTNYAYVAKVHRGANGAAEKLIDFADANVTAQIHKDGNKVFAFSAEISNPADEKGPLGEFDTDALAKIKVAHRRGYQVLPAFSTYLSEGGEALVRQNKTPKAIKDGETGREVFVSKPGSDAKTHKQYAKAIKGVVTESGTIGYVEWYHNVVLAGKLFEAKKMEVDPEVARALHNFRRYLVRNMANGNIEDVVTKDNLDEHLSKLRTFGNGKKRFE